MNQTNPEGVQRPAVEPCYRVREVGVDWLTVTCQGAARRPLFDAMAQDILEQQEAAGNRRAEWTWKGFGGWRCGQCSWGSRQDCSIATLSGSASATWWRRLSLLSTNCSRIDLAVTVEAPDDPELVARAAQAYQFWKRRSPHAAEWSYVTSSTGETFYIGRRSSDLFARIYDKGAEDPDNYEEQTYRFEIEIKGRTAQPTLARLRQEPRAESAVLGTVGAYFRSRGIAVPWDTPGTEIKLKPFRTVSTDESRIQWLADTVAPAVADLLTRHDRAIVLAALGLAE